MDLPQLWPILGRTTHSPTVLYTTLSAQSRVRLCRLLVLVISETRRHTIRGFR